MLLMVHPKKMNRKTAPTQHFRSSIFSSGDQKSIEHSVLQADVLCHHGIMTNRNSLNLFILVALVTIAIAGCGSGGGQVSLLNESGQKLEPWYQRSSGQLAEATQLVFDGRQYDTPYGSQLKLLKVLKPLLQGDQLKVLKKQQPAYVTEWNAVLLPTGKVFVCGGQMKSPSSKQMEAVPFTWFFDPKTGNLQEGPHMLVARDRSSSVTLLQDGRVLVTGGSTSLSYGTGPATKSVSAGAISECEMYDPKTQRFEDVGKMCLPRCEHGVVQLHDGTVLIVGGMTTKDRSNQNDLSWSFPQQSGQFHHEVPRHHAFTAQ